MGRMARGEARRCPRCGSERTVRDGRAEGRPRWVCHECGRSFGATTGTAVAGLHTAVEEVARTLLVLLRRSSFRATEEVTGHQQETVQRWLLRAAAHAEALTQVLVRDLHLSAVEIDEFWSFVARKRGALRPSHRRRLPHRPLPPAASAGAA